MHIRLPTTNNRLTLSASVQAKDTALHLAIETASVDAAQKAKDVCKALLEAQAPVDAKNRKRRTPYELAQELEDEAFERKRKDKEPLEQGGVAGLAALVAKYDANAAAYESRKDKKGKKKKKGR